MQQGWEIKKLGEIAEIVGGSTPKTNEPSYWGGEHYWVTPAVLDGAKYISSTPKSITDAGVKSAHLQLLPIGTVLLSSRAPIGKVAITTVPMYCNQGFKNLVCSDKLYNEFAYWFLYHNTEYLNSLGTGATFKEISKRVVEQIPIPIPSLEEQERIVEILDREFERIDALKANAEHNLQHAKDLFQSALKQELQPKEGWDISTLGDVCDIQGGSTPKRTEKAFWDNGTYPWFTVEDIREQGRIITNTKQKITKLAWDKLRVFPKNTVLLCCTASLGEYALTKIPLTSNQQFNGLSIKDENLLNPMYLLHYCSTLKDKLFTLSGKTTIDFVATGKVKQIEISFPSLVEQEKVVARLDKLKEHCTALEENYRKTIALCDDMKQALLRKAFNGEL